MAQITPKNQAAETYAEVTFVSITEHQQGQRIDNFLFRQLKGVPKSRVYRILRKGEVRVNKGRIKPDYKLQCGDRLRIPPIRTSQTLSTYLPLPAWLIDLIQQPIYEDEALIVINKPSGLAVHGGSGIRYGLIEAMRQYKPDWPFLELAHRIDRETSGCVVLAKTRQALSHLHQQFRREQGQLEKVYLAMLGGALPQAATVRAALKLTRDNKGIKRMMLAADGRSAKSSFIPIAHFDHLDLGAITYARIQLETGRMHQARVHAFSLDSAILGDKLYGNWALNRGMKSLGVKRCLLHAERYRLTHPLTGQLCQFVAPVPQDFQRLLTQLEANTV